MENVQKLNVAQKTIVGIQFLFVAFGATVLVPLLVGLDPSTALFTAGIGTLLFHAVTKGQIPLFLGSSFAFIEPINKASALYGMPGVMGGVIAVGVVYWLVSSLVKWKGISLIKRLFPPVVIGPVIILIGLSLAGEGVKMASNNWIVALIALAAAVVISIVGRGLIKLIPVFVGIAVGYIVAIPFGLVDFAPIVEASWFALPQFVAPKLSWGAIIFLAPVAIAPVIEHVGALYALNGVAGKDFVKDPGLDRSLFGDGLACMTAGIFGGPPVTIYSEVTGAISLTKVVDPAVLRIAAVTGIVFSVIGKVSAVLKSIPECVLGGIMMLLFGTIASVGITTMVNEKVNLGETRNIIIASLTLTFGIGGAIFSIGEFSMTGIGLAAVIGVALNLILPGGNKAEEKLEN
jgi:uracil-xanthine permease